MSGVLTSRTSDGDGKSTCMGRGCKERGADPAGAPPLRRVRSLSDGDYMLHNSRRMVYRPKFGVPTKLV